MHLNFTSSIYALASLASLPQLAVSSQEHCRCFPGDDCWPSAGEWNTFNASVNGQLVATVPLGAPCHDSRFGEYNETACRLLQDLWTLPEVHYNSSSSIMAPFFANRSCDPFAGRDSQCIIGTYVQYSVRVEKAEDVQKALAFAQEKNIRIVIRNTGHDYNGKSIGAGALGIWTHYLKDIGVFNFTSNHTEYRGPAMKLGAGVQGFEAYAEAHKHNLAVIGGECPTVGLAGGYTQGAGHSVLASKYGLAADQVLEWEVIDGRQRHLIATRNNNSDLFWALGGGGGGTYGVVLSMTVKAYPELPTTGANLTFTSEGIDQDTYWDAIGTYHASLPAIVDEGIMAVSFFDNQTFAINPLTGPGVTVSRMNELLSPLTTKLPSLNITYTTYIHSFPTTYDSFNAMFPLIEVGTFQYGGRLIPRSAVENNNSAITSAYRTIANNGGGLTIVALNVNHTVAGGDVYNAVNPAWRTTLLDTVVTTPWNFTAPWEEMQARADQMTDEFIPLLKEVSPGSGTYLNEADFQDPEWKENYYGVNYDRLLEVKDTYDPEHLFNALTAVGSDYWQPQGDGRLCRSSSNVE